MKIKLFLLAIQFTFQLIFCEISPVIQDYQTISTFQCIKTTGYQWATILILSNSTNIDPNSIQNLYNAKNAGLQTQIIYETCRGISPQQNAQMIKKNIIAESYGRIWIFLSASDDVKCNWSVKFPKQNCEYFQRFQAQIKKLGKNVGFLISMQLWGSLVGDRLGCQEVSSSPLWYLPDHIEQQQPTFDDYVQIGGWKNPSMKIFSAKQICGAYTDLNYYIQRPKL